MESTKEAHFRALINARLTALRDEDTLGKDAQKTVVLDQQSVGRLSRMDALQNQAMAKAGQARRDIEVKRLTAALIRLNEGEYGFCEDCGDEIALKRLELDPAAMLCIGCASG
ncbi:TraR/DksA family transcriptional regulator [Rhodalgimonas zhirmunskyi]|uniref:TraR/DksA C4-type zinc finger protein n=1 Tax=Rhodalgimonas zhirmunskyi TaxID=2964767 RepID=A0AAJ1U3G5_9RHOB|nr:TraR/DksA C4-type zinc finger protein [Rhodoalgimonas zhirmunskyi]MDQ2092540.1 TraR/DksA C4-type zinc finger protein [Rhodoalgimonas zhirmunskyi]